MIVLMFIKGIVIGMSNVMPGVSGATMAVILGVYEEMLELFSNIVKHPIKMIKQYWSFILGILLGIVLALFGVVFLVKTYPIAMMMFLVGLIIGGIPKVADITKEQKPQIFDILILLLMIILIIVPPLIKSEPVSNITFGLDSFVLLFALGAIAAGAMILPGLSGSVILLALGYYMYITATFSDFIKALFSLDMVIMKETIILIIPFGLGIVLGLVYVSKAIKYLLEKHYYKVYYAILGLLIASPFSVIWAMFDDEELNYVIHQSRWYAWIIGGIMLALGSVISTWMSNLDNNNNNNNNIIGEKDE